MKGRNEGPETPRSKRREAQGSANDPALPWLPIRATSTGKLTATKAKLSPVINPTIIGSKRATQYEWDVQMDQKVPDLHRRSALLHGSLEDVDPGDGHPHAKDPFVQKDKPGFPPCRCRRPTRTQSVAAASPMMSPSSFGTEANGDDSGRSCIPHSDSDPGHDGEHESEKRTVRSFSIGSLACFHRKRPRDRP